MTDAIKMLLQMQSVFLQLESTLSTLLFSIFVGYVEGAFVSD
jgi:hypothetical protein